MKMIAAFVLALLLAALPAAALDLADGRGVPMQSFAVRLVNVSGTFAQQGYSGPCGPIVAAQVRTVYRQAFPAETNQQTLYFWYDAACESLTLAPGDQLLITDAVYFGSKLSSSAPGIGGDRVDVFGFEVLSTGKPRTCPTSELEPVTQVTPQPPPGQ